MSETKLNVNQINSPIVVNATSTTLEVVANTVYKYSSAINSLTISSVEVSDYESVIYFTTGAGTNGVVSFTDTSNLSWGGGSTPTLEPNTKYCIAICNGYAEIDNFGTVS